MSETKICCICGKPFEGWGNNPDGAAWKNENGEIELGEFPSDACCCDECNSRYVVPGRIYRMHLKARELKGDKSND